MLPACACRLSFRSADETGGWRESTREDLDFVVSDAALGELPPPDTYEMCLANPSDFGRFRCLTAPFETALGVGNEGWQCDEGI